MLEDLMTELHASLEHMGTLDDDDEKREILTRCFATMGRFHVRLGTVVATMGNFLKEVADAKSQTGEILDTKQLGIIAAVCGLRKTSEEDHRWYLSHKKEIGAMRDELISRARQLWFPIPEQFGDPPG